MTIFFSYLQYWLSRDNGIKIKGGVNFFNTKCHLKVFNCDRVEKFLKELKDFHEFQVNSFEFEQKVFEPIKKFLIVKLSISFQTFVN